MMHGICAPGKGAFFSYRSSTKGEAAAGASAVYNFPPPTIYRQGFDSWRVLTYELWGEDPSAASASGGGRGGRWTLEAENVGEGGGRLSAPLEVAEWRVIMFGTEEAVF